MKWIRKEKKTTHRHTTKKKTQKHKHMATNKWRTKQFLRKHWWKTKRRLRKYLHRIEFFHSEVGRQSEESFLYDFRRAIPMNQMDDTSFHNPVILHRLHVVLKKRAFEFQLVKICKKSVGVENSLFDCRKCVSRMTTNFQFWFVGNHDEYLHTWKFVWQLVQRSMTWLFHATLTETKHTFLHWRIALIHRKFTF